MIGETVCSAHNPKLPADTRFGSHAQARDAASGVERRYPRLRETVERIIEERAHEIVGAAIESLTATTLLLDKQGGEHLHPDHYTRLRAADTLLQRALGRPAQETTITADVRSVSVNFDGAHPDVRQKISELLSFRPAAPDGRNGAG